MISVCGGKKLTLLTDTVTAIFNSRRGGFTLIEAVIVMVIVVILAAVAIMKNPFDSIKLSSATKKVATDIRYVQKLAISNQTRAGMIFNANGYNVYQDITVPTPAKSSGDVCSSDVSNNFVVDFTQSRCSSYSGTTLGFSNATIAFNSLGSPVNPATGNTVTSNQTVTVIYKGNKTITVEAGTGRVSY